MREVHLVLHGLAIKKHCTAAAAAAVAGIEESRAEQLLNDCLAKGRVVAVQGKYMLAPLTRMALEGEYSRVYDSERSNDQFVQAYEEFERVNVLLKALITDWQSLTIGGVQVVNDHSQSEYDERIIAKIGDLHERADEVLTRLATILPRLEYYRRKLLQALEKSEDGAIEWVSDAKIDSYHTVWFELHEDLLRVMGRTRVE